MSFRDKKNINNAIGLPSGRTFFSPALNSLQRQQADLPGSDPEPPRNFFVTPDSRGISNNKDSAISLDIHIDFLPSHTKLHVYIASQQGGNYIPGAPLAVIGDAGKGGEYKITLSPVPSAFYIVYKAISEKTGISVPNVTGTSVINLD
jgi:hypothetical protein